MNTYVKHRDGRHTGNTVISKESDNTAQTKISSTYASSADPLNRGPSFTKSTDDITKVMGHALADLSSAAPNTSQETLLPVDGKDVAIDFIASGSPEDLAEDLAALGAKDLTTFGNVISAKLPAELLETASQLESLQFARPVYTPNASVGSVTSQGDSALKADITRSNFGVDGTGVTVGVLSDSFNNLGGQDDDITSGDLPAGVQVLDDLNTSQGTDEGRAMAQLIYDVAPGVDLQFHTAFEGQASFAQGIKDLADAGSNIIVDDVIYFTEPMFQDGIIAQAIDEVTAAGITYLSSAGNSASQSYESEFRGVNDPTLEASYLWHDFDPGAGVDTRQQFTLKDGESTNLSFQWDQPFASAGGPGSANDLDIFILDQEDQTVASGKDFNISNDAVEVVFFENTSGSTKTYDLLIGQYTPQGGPTAGLIKYVDFRGGTSDAEFFTNSSTSYGHPNALGALTVGAAFYQNTPAFGQRSPIAQPFTARGGLPIRFDADGNRLAMPDQRDTVDFVAPDGGNTTFFGDGDFEADGSPNFFGTSAAAPHAAGVAALMLESDPSLSPQAIETVFETTAVDMNAPGADRLTGAGLIQADAALASLDMGKLPPNPDPEPIPTMPDTTVFGEFGNLSLNQSWQTIQLENTYVDPVVMVSDPTFRGQDPAVVRLQNVTGEGFQARIQEPNYKDGRHITESVSYLVVEAGDWTLADGTRIAAGSYNSAKLTSAGFESVDLTGFDHKPTVLSQVQTTNDDDWVVTRTTQSSPGEVKIAMQEEEALNNGSHGSETIGWFAIDQGITTSSDTLLQGGITDTAYTERTATVTFEQAFDAAPSVIAKLGSSRGLDTANVRLGDITEAGFGARVYEEQSLDSELNHHPEAISFLALEGQSGSLVGVAV